MAGTSQTVFYQKCTYLFNIPKFYYVTNGCVTLKKKENNMRFSQCFTKEDLKSVTSKGIAPSMIVCHSWLWTTKL